MFTNHFIGEAQNLQKSLEKALAKYSSKKPSSSEEKDLRVFEGFYQFIQKHLPESCFLSSGGVRNQKQILKKNCDLVLYKRWCESYLEMTGGYILTEDLYAFMSIDVEFNASTLNHHVSLTRAIKSLYTSQETDEAKVIIPIYSILFVYHSSSSLLQIKKELEKLIERKEIILSQQVDMICVLDKGFIIKDWENGGIYRGIQSGKDTLMWFYVMLMEYLDQKDRNPIIFRNYVKEGRDYPEC